MENAPSITIVSNGAVLGGQRLLLPLLPIQPPITEGLRALSGPLVTEGTTTQLLACLYPVPDPEPGRVSGPLRSPKSRTLLSCKFIGPDAVATDVLRPHRYPASGAGTSAFQSRLVTPSLSHVSRRPGWRCCDTQTILHLASLVNTLYSKKPRRFSCEVPRLLRVIGSCESGCRYRARSSLRGGSCSSGPRSPRSQWRCRTASVASESECS